MLKPMDARVIVKKSTRQEQTESGIILPDTVNEAGLTAQGEVIAVGPGSLNYDGEKRIPMSLNVGDVIIYEKFSGKEINHNGEDVVVLTQNDVIAVVEED